MEAKELIARRAAKELHDGEVVNIGFGIPQDAIQYVPKNIKLIFHSENGILGFGQAPTYEEADPDLGDAASFPCTLQDGASIFDLATSLCIMRGGHIDTTILGALQVDQDGNIANWAIPTPDGKYTPGMGGAMDLVVGAKKVIATLTHTDKYGNPKVLKHCTFPLTAAGVVKTIITDKAVFNVTKDGLVLKEVAPGLSVEDIKKITEADFTVAEDLKEFDI